MPRKYAYKRYRKANRKRSFTRSKAVKRLSRRIKAVRPQLKFVNIMARRDTDANYVPLNTYTTSPQSQNLEIHTQGGSNTDVEWATFILNPVLPTNSSLVSPIDNIGQRTGWKIRSKFVNIRLKLSTSENGSRWRVLLVANKQNTPIDPSFPVVGSTTTTLNGLFQNASNSYSPVNDGFLTSPLQDRYRERFSVYYDKVIVPDSTKGNINYLKIKKRLNQICHYDNVNAPAATSSLYTYDIPTKGCLFLVILKTATGGAPADSIGTYDLDHRYYFTDN